MPIPFTCPHCGHSTSVDVRYAGQAGPCAHCGQTVVVPPLTSGKSSGTSAGCIVGIVLAAVLGPLVVIACIGILVALLLPAVQASREAAREASHRMQCQNQERQFGFAMMEYESSGGHFPAAAIKDPDTGAVHSWRVEILPYIEQQALYDEFRLDEPWDSEHNLRLAETVVPTFQCPSQPLQFKMINGHRVPCTNYAMITSNNACGYTTGAEMAELKTIGGDGPSFSEVMDGEHGGRTILIVEITGDDLPAWTEPADVCPEDFRVVGYVAPGEMWGPGAGGARRGFRPGSYHPGGMNVVRCDGSVDFVSYECESDQLMEEASYGEREAEPELISMP